MIRNYKALLGKGTRPPKGKFRWNAHHPQPRDRPERTLDDLHEISLGVAIKGPLAFTMAVPKPLGGFDMNTIELENGQFVTASNMDQQTPCAKIVPDRMGLHAHLLDKMKAHFGMEKLTPIQARVLQCFHARYDICSCAPTGSGKTLAICIGLVARLMRDGPPKQGSTVFLVPTEELGYQIERWLRVLWWYSEDADPLFLAHCTSAQEVAAAYAVDTSEEDTVTSRGERFILPNLSNNIRYPERNPYILLTSPDPFWEWLQHRVPMKADATNKKLFPQIDTIVIDEVESVLTVDANLADKNCKGRQILQQMYVCKPYDAPINVVFNSATLAPTTVNHLQKYLKKNVFDPATVKMFSDTNARGEYVSETRTGHFRGDVRKGQVDGDKASLTFVPFESLYDDPATRMHFSKMRYGIPSSIHVCFYLIMKTHGVSKENHLRALLESIRTLLRGRLLCAKALVVTATDEDEALAIRLLQSFHEIRSTEERVQKLETQRKSASHNQLSDTEPGARLPEDAASRDERDSRNNAEPAHQPASEQSTQHQTIIVSSARRIKGIDIPELKAVFIACAPKNVMDFVHLAGRVGRLGNTGKCIFFIQPGDCRQMKDYCSILNISFDVLNETEVFGA